jgi:hypothetical protein
MGRVGKGISCSVKGCSNNAERSVSKDQLSDSGLILNSEERRIYLCRKHYKNWKKATKRSRKLERSRWT